MTCPWLKKENGVYKCTAVSPPVELDFEVESPPDLNGEICKLPKPEFTTTEPWNRCRRYKPT
jgi:hypothetical protein